jgi:hypothetical protein
MLDHSFDARNLPPPFLEMRSGTRPQIIDAGELNSFDGAYLYANVAGHGDIDDQQAAGRITGVLAQVEGAANGVTTNQGDRRCSRRDHGINTGKSLGDRVQGDRHRTCASRHAFGTSQSTIRNHDTRARFAQRVTRQLAHLSRTQDQHTFIGQPADLLRGHVHRY